MGTGAERVIRGRLPEVLDVEEDFQRFQITESRRTTWRNLALTGFVILVFGAGLCFTVWEDRDGLQVVLILVAVLGGIPFAMAALFFCPWNRSVVVDLRDGTCVLQRRFYWFPVRSRYCSLWDGRVFVAPVLHTRVETVAKDSDTGIGCLMHLLGPIGLLYTAFSVMNSVSRVRQQVWALMYEDTRSETSEPLILICCASSVQLRQCEAFCSQWTYS